MDKYIGREGRFVGMSTFGKSAPYKKLYEYFGITPDHIVRETKAALGT